MYLITSTSTFHHESTSALLFWGNVLKYIPSTFKMYLSTIRSTFQLPSNFVYPENQTKFLT